MSFMWTCIYLQMENCNIREIRVPSEIVSLNTIVVVVVVPYTLQ